MILQKQTLFSTLASLGYIAELLLFLQSLAVIVVTVLQYAIANHINIATKPTKTSDLVTTLFSPNATATTPTVPQEPNVVLIAGAWIALIVMVVALAIYMTTVTSKIVHSLAAKFWKQVTAKRLLTVKLVIAGISFGIILLSSAALPAIWYIVPLNFLLAAMCSVLFCAQHILARHYNIPLKKLL